MATSTKKTTAAKKKAVVKPQPVVRKIAKKKPAPAKPHGEDGMLSKFFVSELKDIYWAEKHLLKVLPKMEKNATASELKKAFADHRKVTEGHATRLEQVFGLLKEKPAAKKCEAMAGITKEGDDIISETDKGTETRDVGLIFAAQKVEHYEIATYGSLAELARTLNLKNVADILEKTLAEEKEADETLSKLAVRNINQAASQEGEKPGFFEKMVNMVS